MKLNPIIPGRGSDELYAATIGYLNANVESLSLEYKTQVIHMFDAVSRGYISPMEAYEAMNSYISEHILAAPSLYAHLL